MCPDTIEVQPHDPFESTHSNIATASTPEFDNEAALVRSFRESSLGSRYELLGELGRGGMAIVYQGRHKLLGHTVAIKVHNLGQGVDRFQREAKLLASITSRHVIRVHDFEILADGKAMLIMNCVAGKNLARIMRASEVPIAEPRAISWMLQVCEGMQAAAELGIVHRDLKPSNILIDERDEAHVADFGLARAGTTEPITQTGGIMGTPHYMAPEQAEDPRSVDLRADIYSFGATFYHVVTRRPPFIGESWFSILFSHKTEPLVPPIDRNPLISSRLNDCLIRCLAKNPRDRFQSFVEIADELKPDLEAEEKESPGDAEAPEVAINLARYSDRKAIYLGKVKEEMPTGDRYDFSNGRILTIKFDNLAEQKVDALVSPEDEALSMIGGISGSLGKVGGRRYVETAGEFSPVCPGRAVITPAGSLPSRFVIHGIVHGFWKSDWIFPSRQLITEIMESCFFHADTLGLTSIAFPPLGTGIGGFPREVCLDTMFRYLIRKLVTGVTSINEVRIILASDSKQWRD